MASKLSTRKNTNGPNQPPSCQVKGSVSDNPLNFITFDFFGRYSPHNPSQSTPDPNYTSSPKTLDPNQDSSSNEELRGVTSEQSLYRIPNNEVDQLRRDSRAYLKSISQIPVIY
jgi:hypothetical protein